MPNVRTARARSAERAVLGLVTALLLLLFGASPADAQRLGITKGFKVLGENFEAPHDTQPRSLLEGVTAQSMENGDQLLTGVTLQTYRETGERELLVKAPQCFFDRVAKTASSPGPLQVQTADGKFSIEGEGFFWGQTNSSLVISNKVRTRIAAEMFENPAAPGVQQPSETPGPIEILGDYFEYSRASGKSYYRGNVRVLGTNQMSLNSQILEIQLPMDQRQLQSIRAEKDVVVDYGGIQATGQVAIYSAQTGLVRLLGSPAWRADQRQGGADELTIDRTNRIFRADGNAWFRSPAQGLSIAGLLTQTNEVPRPSQKIVSQSVEVRSGAYEFRTNWVLFDRDVRLKEIVEDRVRGTLNSGLLSAAFKGSNQLETLTARTNVVIKDGTNWLECGSAVLTGSNGVLEATEAPSWGSGTRTGKGKLVRISTRANDMLVSGDASLRLPARELAETSAIRPGATNTGPAARFATNNFAQIFCDEYNLRPDSAHFRGGVYATHPRMNWTSESLSIELPRAGSREQTLVAEKGVKFQFSGENGELVEGAGERAVYVYGVQGTATNDLLTLTGGPATLNTTNGAIRNETIIYDRIRGTLRTPGKYSISGTNKLANTNVLELPKSKLTR